MSALTKSERDGLEDVFSSIHINHNKDQKFKDFTTLLLSKESSLQLRKLIKVAKYGLKEIKLPLFIDKTDKKKKHLSK